MKKRLILLTFATAIMFAVTAVAQSTETRSVTVNGSYDAVVMAGTQKFSIEVGPAQTPFTVKGTSDDLDNLEITIKNNTLTIHFKKGYRSKSNQAVEIRTTNPMLKKATVSGTGTIDITGRLDVGRNDFSVSGTGSINIQKIDCREAYCSISGTGHITSADLKAADKVSASVSGTGSITLSGIDTRTVEVKSSGTGKITLSGNTTYANFVTSGTGNINADDLKAVDVEATTSGTGNINCRCSGKFTGRASALGKITVSGNPTSVSFSGNDKRLVRK